MYSFVYWIDLGGGQVPMKIARVRFDGKHPENIIVDNLLQPNYLVYNLDLHCVFWSDIGLQRVNPLFTIEHSNTHDLFDQHRLAIIAWTRVTPKCSMSKSIIRVVSIF
jgi:hypothetical protein